MLNGTASQLVTEADARRAHLQDAVLLGLDQTVELSVEQRPDQVELDVRGHDGQLLARTTRSATEAPDPRQHGFGHRCRHSVAAGRENLVEVEGIALGQGVQEGRVSPGPGRERLDRAPRKPAERDPVYVATREPTEQLVQWVIRVEHLVAESEHEDRPQPVESAGQEAEHVEGGVVRPLQILHDKHRRPGPGQLLDRRGEDRIARATVEERSLEHTTGSRRGITQRPQRPRDEQVVAGPAQDADVAVDGGEEGADDARLPDAFLSRQQHRRPAPGRRVGERRAEHVDRALPLEQGDADGTPPGRASGGLVKASVTAHSGASSSVRW